MKVGCFVSSVLVGAAVVILVGEEDLSPPMVGVEDEELLVGEKEFGWGVGIEAFVGALFSDLVGDEVIGCFVGEEDLSPPIVGVEDEELLVGEKEFGWGVGIEALVGALFSDLVGDEVIGCFVGEEDL